MKTLEEMRAALRKMQDALPELKEKAFGDAGTETDLKALEDSCAEIEKLERQIEARVASEAASARAAKASTSAISTAVATVPGMVKSPLAPPQGMTGEDVLCKTMAAQLIAKGSRQPVLEVLVDQGYQALADVLGSVTVNGKAVNTLVPAEGGLLVPTPVSGGIMPLLRLESTFINAGPVRVPLTNGQFVLARGLAGATASYIAEGALKPVSTPTFDSISMRAKKLAGIVPITDEAVKWTIGDIEAYVRNDLKNALALTLDLNAWLGTGAGASPLGILNKPGVQTVTPTFAAPTNPTLAELDNFATAMILKLVTVNIFANSRWRWVMPYRSAMKLSNIRVGATTDGEKAFPEMNLGLAGGPNWKGFPVIITSQLPTTGGGTTDETTISLIDFSHVLFGEEEGITTKQSDVATLNVDGGSTLVHLWQQNMIAILAEAMHDFGLRTTKAVVKATIRW